MISVSYLIPSVLCKISSVVSNAMKEADQEHVRIKYFSLPDLAYFFNVAKIPKLLDTLDNKTCPDDINDIINYYNAALYLADGPLLPELKEEEKRHYRKQIGSLYRRIEHYFDSINKDNFILLEKCDAWYLKYDDDLFSLLERYNLDKKVGIQLIIKLWENINGSPQSLLYRERLVTDYDSEICELIIANSKFSEFLINYHFSSDKMNGIFLPKSLSDEDVIQIFRKYLESDRPNLNYVGDIINSKSRYGLVISDKIKLIARRKIHELEQEIFGDNDGDLIYSVEVRIQEKSGFTSNASLQNNGKNGGIFFYNSSFLDAIVCNTNVLHYIFFCPQLLTSDFISKVVSSQSSYGETLTDILTSRGNGEYRMSERAELDCTLFRLHVCAFEGYMNKRKTRFEDIFSLYFNDFIEQNYDIFGFTFTASTLDATYLEKCKHLATEFDAIYRQFKLHVEDGEIDQELLSISSSPVSLLDLPSHFEHKYAEVDAESALPDVLGLLFSTQSRLTVTDKEKNAKNLCELLVHKNVELHDFHEMQQNDVKMLIDFGVLSIKDGYIKFSSRKLMQLLRQLYDVGALNYPYYGDDYKLEIDKLFNQGWLKWKNTLLTTWEGDFFSYCLDKKKFSNALELRNRYAHSVFSREEKVNEELHRNNYIIFLMLYILLINKINDDLFCHYVHIKGEEL